MARPTPDDLDSYSGDGVEVEVVLDEPASRCLAGLFGLRPVADIRGLRQRSSEWIPPLLLVERQPCCELLVINEGRQAGRQAVVVVKHLGLGG